MTDRSIDELGPVDYLIVEFPAGAQNFTGEGADEIFGGYDIFKEDKVRRFIAAQPGLLSSDDRTVEGRAAGGDRAGAGRFFLTGFRAGCLSKVWRAHSVIFKRS